MRKQTKDELFDVLGEFGECMKPGAYLAAAFFIVAGACNLIDKTDTTAHAEPKAEQPAPPSNYAVNQLVLR